jgi:hypothetical protein
MVERGRAWEPIESAPTDGTVIRVQIQDGENTHEYYSFFEERFCTGMCASAEDRRKYKLEYGKPSPEHFRHTHSDWLICTSWGEELQPVDGRMSIMPTAWLPLQQAVSAQPGAGEVAGGL